MTHHMPSDRSAIAETDYCAAQTYASSRLPVSEASTLIPDAYRDDRFYRTEIERLWSRSWVCVGYECQVKNAGDVLTAEVAGQSLLVVRDKQDRLHAFHNVCRHRGAKLVDEKTTRCSVIRCPYHSWGYGLDGTLLGAPYFQGLDVPPGAAEQFRMRAEEAGKFCKKDYGLLSVPIDCWGGMLFVNLDGGAGPLSRWIGDLADRYARYPFDQLQLVRRKAYSIKANWKLVAENFMEYYHLPWVHPELCNISGFKNHHRCQGPGMYTGMCTSPLSVDPDTVKLDLPTFSGLNDTEAQSAYFILLFPNVAIWLFPNHMLTLLYQPTGARSTLEHMDMLVIPSQLDDTKLDHVFEFWDMVNQQDIEIVERVQEGLLSTAYPGGRMCYDFEEPVHRFQNMVIDRMVGIDRIPPGDD